MLLIHEGGQQNVPVTTPPTPVDPSGCANFTGALPPIVAGLDPEFDLVVSGHTHRPYVCELPNSAGTKILATSAGTAGVLVTDITATLSKSQDDFTSLSARNVIVERKVIDQETKTLLDKYRVAVAPIANRIVGSISADITRVRRPPARRARSAT